MPSPKRKHTSSPSTPIKRTRTSPPPTRTTTMPITTSDPPPDSHIDSNLALTYWSSTEASVSGVLGGFPQVSRIDLQGSSNFLAKLRRASKLHPTTRKLKRVVDCGAGIGRITEGFLLGVAETVDVVEPVKGFTDKIAGKEGVGRVFNVGLEAWFPDQEDSGLYDVIWNQWCVGQLTDAQFIAYLRRLPSVLCEGGWIIVKENLSNHNLGEDVYDETDSSVTRTDEKFRRLFEEAGMKVVSSELQRGMPKGLYPVRSYALQPK